MAKSKKTVSLSGNRGIQGQPTKGPTTTTSRETRESSDKGGVNPPTAEASSGDRAPPVYKAHWPTWICRSVVRLDQAVALSCDVEPAALLNPVEFAFGGFDHDDPDETPDADFLLNNQRYEIARSQAGVAFKIVNWVRDERGVRTPRVLMAEFAEWAVRMGEISSVWRQLPAEFRSLAPRNPAPTPAPKAAAEEVLAKTASLVAPSATAQEALTAPASAAAPNTTPENEPEKPKSADVQKPAAKLGPGEPGSQNVSKFTSGVEPQKLSSTNAPNLTAEENPEGLAPPDGEDSVTRGNLAATQEGRDMLGMISALLTEVLHTNASAPWELRKMRELLAKAKLTLSDNTIKKFLNAAKDLKPVENALQCGAAGGTQLHTKQRKSALAMIAALVNKVEGLGKALTGAEEFWKVGAENVAARRTITKYLNEAKALLSQKDQKDTPGNSKD